MKKVKIFVKNFIIFWIPKFIILELDNRFYFKNRGRFYFSQEGEDIVLERFFEGKETGFFIDIGAHHPTHLSNTYKFYLKGWRGINIDATPGSMNEFNKIRPEDINIESGVSAREGEMTYYIMSNYALNTFSKERLDFLLKSTTYKLEKTVNVKIKTIAQILEENLPKGKKIDLLTVDVEGMDYEILSSNNWDKYRPEMVLAEDLNGSLADLSNSTLNNFFITKGYKLVARTYNTMFFKDNIQS